jgi:pimeloyl-ACP methyl ester carboxylesterase
MVPVDDTALAVTDTGGSGRPVIYLNGSYAGQRHWRPVTAELGNDWRHITFDERARGKSKRSADYSFEATLRDLDAVMKARAVERPILVGWSYGAMIAVHWAARHPDRVAGVVSVDGAMPYGLTGDAGRERIRRQFNSYRLLLPLIAPFGLAARMSAAQHADIAIEINQLLADCAPVLDQVSCPLRYVLATGGNLGASLEEMEAVRASLEPVLASKPNIEVSAKVDSNHGDIVRKQFRAIAQAVRETAAAADNETAA